MWGLVCCVEYLVIKGTLSRELKAAKEQIKGIFGQRVSATGQSNYKGPGMGTYLAYLNAKSLKVVRFWTYFEGR